MKSQQQIYLPSARKDTLHCICSYMIVLKYKFFAMADCIALLTYNFKSVPSSSSLLWKSSFGRWVTLHLLGQAAMQTIGPQIFLIITTMMTSKNYASKITQICESDLEEKKKKSKVITICESFDGPDKYENYDQVKYDKHAL